MINVYNFYQDFLDKINKEENGYCNPDVFNRLLRFSSIGLMGDYVTEMQDPARAQRHTFVMDALIPFNKRLILNTDRRGFAPKPEDYRHFSAMRVKWDDADSYRNVIRINNLICEAEEGDVTIDVPALEEELLDLQSEGRYIKVTVYPHDILAQRLSSKIPTKRPTKQKPMSEYAGNGWQVYPSNSSSILLLYYREITHARLDMKLNQGTGNEEYNPATSLNSEWPDIVLKELLDRVVKDWAIYVREPELFQMMEAKTKTV